MICAKCSVDFNSFDDILATLCGHCFHKDCIVNNCSGSYNLVKLKALFNENETEHNNLRVVLELKERNKFVRYQLKKSLEDVYKLKKDLEQSQRQNVEMKLDLDAERKMRRFYQIQLEVAIPSTFHGTNDLEVFPISSDEEVIKDKTKKKSKESAEEKAKSETKGKKKCGLCNSGCGTRQCSCFQASLGFGRKRGCTSCEYPKGKK